MANTPEEHLLNDLMQYILEKNGVKNRLEWRCYVQESEVINAYAMAGGRVVFHTSLLSKMDNLD